MALSTPPPPPDPTSSPSAATNSTTTTTATRPLFSNTRMPPATTQTLAHHPYPHHQPPLYPPQSQSQSQRFPSNPNPNYPQLAPKPAHSDSSAPNSAILYPVASSGRGFLPKPVRSDYSVTIPANPNSNPPSRQSAAYVSRPPFGFSHSDPGMGFVRPSHLQYALLGSAVAPPPPPPPPGGGVIIPAVVKGVPVSASHPKSVAPTSISESNGLKDGRDRTRDDTLAVVRDRKVRITENASLYALCRSWLKNGFLEETQPQYTDFVKSLPRPLPLAPQDMAVKKEDEKEEEDEGSIEQLSPKELLQRHIKRAKRIRSRLREERHQRIGRYKTRLALLLPPMVEQHLRNDAS